MSSSEHQPDDIDQLEDEFEKSRIAWLPLSLAGLALAGFLTIPMMELLKRYPNLNVFNTIAPIISTEQTSQVEQLGGKFSIETLYFYSSNGWEMGLIDPNAPAEDPWYHVGDTMNIELNGTNIPITIRGWEIKNGNSYLYYELPNSNALLEKTLQQPDLPSDATIGDTSEQNRYTISF